MKSLHKICFFVYVLSGIFTGALAERKMCRQMGCTNGLKVEFQLSNHSAYKFELQLDKQTVTCTGRLPLNSCDSKSFQCDSAFVQVEESGCALPASAQQITGLMISQELKEFSIRILENQKQLMQLQRFKPVYEVLQPNGPGCEPQCRFSVVKIKK